MTPRPVNQLLYQFNVWKRKGEKKGLVPNTFMLGVNQSMWYRVLFSLFQILNQATVLSTILKWHHFNHNFK